MTVPVAASIGERGYRRYDGPRMGEGAAITSVWRHTIQRVLGLRRAARHKILPFLTIIIAFLPAVAFIGVLALLPPVSDEGQLRTEFVPTYSEYYGFVSAAILLFVVFVAPEALCPDRRSRSLSLYLASPLKRDTYLLAKLLAIFTVLCIVTIGPLVVLLIGYVVQSNGPDGPLGVLTTLIRIVGAGAAVSLFFTAFAAFMASLTDRKGLATGGSLIALIASQVIGNVLLAAFDLPEGSLLFGFVMPPFELAVRTIDGSATEMLSIPTVPTATVTAAVGAWVVVFLIGVWVRYSTIQVTR